MTTLEELKAKMQAGLPALQQLPQTSPFPAVAQTTAHATAPTAAAPAGLDFNSEEASQGSREVRIPFDVEGTFDLVLDQFIHVQGRKGPFYKAIVTVEGVTTQTVRQADGTHAAVQDLAPGQRRCLMFYYQAQPRIKEEETSNAMTAREIRNLMAACLGASADDRSFDAAAAIGAALKESVVTPSLGLRFRLQNTGYVNPKAKRGYSYAKTYSPRG